MSVLLERVTFKVDDNLDFVTIQFGSINARIGYRIGFVIDHNLRLAAKQAARFDRVPAMFWREVEVPDLEDEPATSRVVQQSRLSPTVSSWAVRVNPPLVELLFDGAGEQMDYETAVKLGHAIRRASRRAKAWAGDRSSYSSMLGFLTDAEEDYRLGLA
jgi:hypothetical protein